MATAMDNRRFPRTTREENLALTLLPSQSGSLDPADRARAEQFSVVRDFINKPLTVDHVKRAAQLLKEARGEGG